MARSPVLLLAIAAAALLLAGPAAAAKCPESKPFDPKTFNWASIYTAYPVNTLIGTGLFANMLGDFTCRGPYALCAYANCSIVHGSNPPVAECGCWVADDTLGKKAVSVGTTPTVLDQNLMNQNEKKCGAYPSTCSNPPNKAPFCKQMLRNSCGKAAMYGGIFDVISTFNTTTWPPGITSPKGGANVSPQYCTSGYQTNCFSAACMLKTAWNGMPATCYCPVYQYPGFILSANSTGYECQGQKVNGVTQYIQNGI